MRSHWLVGPPMPSLTHQVRFPCFYAMSLSKKRPVSCDLVLCVITQRQTPFVCVIQFCSAVCLHTVSISSPVYMYCINNTVVYTLCLLVALVVCHVLEAHISHECVSRQEHAKFKRTLTARSHTRHPILKIKRKDY